MSGQTSPTSVLFHALIFTAVLYGLNVYTNKDKEGFQGHWHNVTWRNLQVASAVFGGLSLGLFIGGLGFDPDTSCLLSSILFLIALIIEGAAATIYFT